MEYGVLFMNLYTVYSTHPQKVYFCLLSDEVSLSPTSFDDSSDSTSCSCANDNSWAVIKGGKTYSVSFQHIQEKRTFDSLTIPKLCVNAILLKQLTMRALFRYMSILQYENLVAVVDGPESVRDEDASVSLLFEDAVDVLQ